MARVAEMVELPPGMAPQSDGRGARVPALGAAPLQATPAAFDGLRVVLFPPMHLKYRPLWAIPTTAAIAILPGYARRMYRHPVVPAAPRCRCAPRCSRSAGC